MSKAQTDIRSTSYSVWTANPQGYQGTIDEALAQIRNDVDHGSDPSYTRWELNMFLGIDNNAPSAGPSVELDESPRYGDEPSMELAFFSLANAAARGWFDAPAARAMNFDPSN